jgi:hypothetical protein
MDTVWKKLVGRLDAERLPEDSLLTLLRQFLVMVDGDHGVGSGRFGLGAGGVAARSTS